MTHRIAFTSKAKLELNQTAIWWAENRSVEQAERWLDGFEAVIQSLAINPERHPPAREDEQFAFTLRQLVYGVGSNPTHRAIFRIRGDEVIIFGIRHLAQRDVSPEDV